LPKAVQRTAQRVAGMESLGARSLHEALEVALIR
jgi:hypothetical protein